MSANKVWLAQCEICDTTKQFDVNLTVHELGEAMREAGWDLPVYGGTFCPKCTKAVEALKNVRSP